MPSVTTILTTILVAVGGFMTFLIMLQEGKGGGLAALSGTKASGIEGVTNPIRRATGYLAGLFFFLAVVLAIINRPEANKGFIKADAEAEKTGVMETEKNGPSVNLAPAPAGPTKPGETVKVELPKAPVPATSEAPKAPVPATTPTPKAVEPETPKAVEPAKTDAPKATEPAKPDAPKPAETPKTPETK